MVTRATCSTSPRECDDYINESTNLLHSAESRLADFRKETLREAERALAIEIVKAMRRIHVLLHDQKTRSTTTQLFEWLDVAAVTRNVRCGGTSEAPGMTGMGAKPKVRSCARWRSCVTESGRKPPVSFGAGKAVKRTFCAPQMNASECPLQAFPLEASEVLAAFRAVPHTSFARLLRRSGQRARR